MQHRQGSAISATSPSPLFFFQAEDGIRDYKVTGVQTCALPISYHKDLVDHFRAKKVGTTVHICGTTHQIHEDLVDVGFVAITIDLDQQSDPALKVDQLDRLVTLGNQRGVVAIGNVDVTIFERATRAEIEAEVRRCIDTVGHRSRFVLSTSCELPPRANPDCVKWFMEAAREYGRWDRILAR